MPRNEQWRPSQWFKLSKTRKESSKETLIITGYVVERHFGVKAEKS